MLMKGISGKEHLTDVNGLDVQTFLYSLTSRGLGVTKPRASSFSFAYLIYQQVLPPLPPRQSQTLLGSLTCPWIQATITSGWMVAVASSRASPRSPRHSPRPPHLWLPLPIPDVPATLGSSPNITTRPTYRNSLLYSVTLQIKAIAPKLVILKISFRKGSSGS